MSDPGTEPQAWIALPDPDAVAASRPADHPYNFGFATGMGRLLAAHPQIGPAFMPVLTYHHTSHRCAIVGGYVIRDPSLHALAARYLYGDFCTGELRTVQLPAGKARDDQPLPLRVPSLTSFGQDTTGRLYATSIYGPVYRLTAR